MAPAARPRAARGPAPPYAPMSQPAAACGRGWASRLPFGPAAAAAGSGGSGSSGGGAACRGGDCMARSRVVPTVCASTRGARRGCQGQCRAAVKQTGRHHPAASLLSLPAAHDRCDAGCSSAWTPSGCSCGRAETRARSWGRGAAPPMRWWRVEYRGWRLGVSKASADSRARSCTCVPQAALSRRVCTWAHARAIVDTIQVDDELPGRAHAPERAASGCPALAGSIRAARGSHCARDSCQPLSARRESRCSRCV